MERSHKCRQRPCTPLLLAFMLLAQDLATGVIPKSAPQLEMEGTDGLLEDSGECSNTLEAVCSGDWDEALASGRWIEVPVGRFDYFVSVRGWDFRHRCSGIVVDPSWVLTAAHCIKHVGPNAMVYLTPPATGGAVADDATRRRVTHTVVHPHWNGSVEHGWDAALLHLHSPVHILGPTLVAPNFNVVPSTTLITLAFRGTTAKMAKMTVVPSHQCPGLNDLGPGLLCIWSSVAQLVEGDSGGPALIAYGPTGPNDFGNCQNASAALDLLVGIVSYSNLKYPSGQRGAALESMMHIRQWIFDVVYPKDIHRSRDHQGSVGNSSVCSLTLGDLYEIFGIAHVLGTWLFWFFVAIVLMLAAPLALLRNEQGKGFQRTAEEKLIAGRVPCVLAHYVARPEFEQAAQNHLTHDHQVGSRKCVSIEGMAGFGKTALAIAIVHDEHLVKFYRGGVLWINMWQDRGIAGNPLVYLFHDVYSHMLQLIEGRTIANSGFSGWKEKDYLLAINKLVKSKLVLLVLDGVRDKVVLEAVLKVDCALIVTSQMRDALCGVDGALTLQVGALNNEASQQLLRNVAGEGADHEATNKILELSEGHPLALSIMGKGLGSAFSMEEDAKLAEIDRLLTLVCNTADRVHLVMEDFDLLTVEAQNRHRMLSRCLEFTLDGLDEGERACFILLVVLPRGTCASPEQLHRLWALGSMERTEERIRMLEGRYLLHRCSNCTFGLHRLQHDFLHAVTSTQTRYKSMVEAARGRLGSQ